MSPATQRRRTRRKLSNMARSRNQAHSALGFLVGLAATVVATWHGTRWLLFWHHVRGFSGTCGPHAPDIPAHACTYAEYVAEFDVGFAGVGVLFWQVVAVMTTVTGFLAVWLLARRRTPIGSSGAGDS